MNPHEIVVPIVNRKRGFKAGKSLGKGVGESRKSTHTHSHGQILSLHHTRGDVPDCSIPCLMT